MNEQIHNKILDITGKIAMATGNIEILETLTMREIIRELAELTLRIETLETKDE